MVSTPFRQHMFCLDGFLGFSPFSSFVLVGRAKGLLGMITFCFFWGGVLLKQITKLRHLAASSAFTRWFVFDTLLAPWLERMWTRIFLFLRMSLNEQKILSYKALFPIMFSPLLFLGCRIMFERLDVKLPGPCNVFLAA